MHLGDIIYIIAIVLFIFMTFGIIKNFYKSKFDKNENRIDMKDKDDEI